MKKIVIGLAIATALSGSGMADEAISIRWVEGTKTSGLSTSAIVVENRTSTAQCLHLSIIEAGTIEELRYGKLSMPINPPTLVTAPAGKNSLISFEEQNLPSGHYQALISSRDCQKGVDDETTDLPDFMFASLRKFEVKN